MAFGRHQPVGIAEFAATPDLDFLTKFQAVGLLPGITVVSQLFIAIDGALVLTHSNGSGGVSLEAGGYAFIDCALDGWGSIGSANVSALAIP